MGEPVKRTVRKLGKNAGAQLDQPIQPRGKERAADENHCDINGQRSKRSHGWTIKNCRRQAKREITARTLTLTLSHPMGEGTGAERFKVYCAMVCTQRVHPFSLSHRMGEGRGEGFRFAARPSYQPSFTAFFKSAATKPSTVWTFASTAGSNPNARRAWLVSGPMEASFIRGNFPT